MILVFLKDCEWEWESRALLIVRTELPERFCVRAARTKPGRIPERFRTQKLPLRYSRASRKRFIRAFPTARTNQEEVRNLQDSRNFTETSRKPLSVCCKKENLHREVSGDLRSSRFPSSSGFGMERFRNFKWFVRGENLTRSFRISPGLVPNITRVTRARNFPESSKFDLSNKGSKRFQFAQPSIWQCFLGRLATV